MIRKEHSFKGKATVITALLGGLGFGSAQGFELNGSFTGNWWEGPEKSGRGFLLEVTEADAGNMLIVNWFTYDDAGNQIWLNGADPIPSGSNSVTVNLIRKEGGQFGPAFQAADASTINWGEATFTFQSCDHAQVAYNGLDGNGTLEIQNFTRPQGVQCTVGQVFDGCPDFAREGPEPGFCVLEGTYTSDITLTSNTNWILRGGVFIGGDNTDSATLTIAPGTRLKGEGVGDFLYIRRGSKIMAEGTAQNPIIFTGPLEQFPGEWGGVVLAGNAPVNGCLPDVAVCEQFDEALSTPFGGNDPHDNSGVMKYVQIRWAGFEFRPDEELNSLTLLAVGNGTVLDYIQTHEGLDDGIEMFGGTVNMKHIVMTNMQDDNLDWQFGWTGKAQFGLIVKGQDSGDHGIEADNNELDFESQPRSKPIVANMTVIGSPVSNDGVMLRRGTAGNLYNMVFTGFGRTCINISNESTFAVAGTPENLSGELTMEHSWVNCAVNFDDDPGDPWLISDWFFAQPGNVADDPQLDGYLPAEGSPLLNGGTAVPDGFFEPTDYVGAFRDRNDDWTRGWTIGLDHLRN